MGGARFYILVALAAPLFVALPACSAHTKPGSYVLRYRFRPGQADRYAFRLAVNTNLLQGVATTGSATEVFKVDHVNPDGSAVITSSVLGLTSSAEPKATPGHDSAYRFTMTPRGEVRTSAANAVPRGRRPLGDPESLARMGTLLPERSVKIGDTWTTRIVNPMSGAGFVIVQSSIVLAERVHGADTVRIHQSFKVPIGSPALTSNSSKPVSFRGELKVNSTVNFSPDQGKVIRSSTLGSGTFDIGAKAGQNINAEKVTLSVDVSLELLP